MPPRRPTAPHAGAAARAQARPAARSAPVSPPPAAARPAARAGSRPPAGRGPTRPSGAGAPAARSSRPPVVRPVTVLSGVMVVVVLLLAPYVRPWVQQRAQIENGKEQVEALQKQVDQLNEELRRWDDPEYVRKQARQRLNFVMPGESGFVLLDDTARPATRPDPRSVAAAVPGGDDTRVWYSKVWDSIRIAGDPTTEQARGGAAVP